MARRGLLLVLAVLVVAEGGLYHSVAQLQGTQQQPAAPPGILPPSSANSAEPDPNAARQERATAKFAVEDRRKRMASDVDKLLQLATQLKAEVDRASKDETSVSAYRKADEIERLAHDVKQRIKN